MGGRPAVLLVFTNFSVMPERIDHESRFASVLGKISRSKKSARIAKQLRVDRQTVRRYLPAAAGKSPINPHTGLAEADSSKSPTNPHTGSPAQTDCECAQKACR